MFLQRHPQGNDLNYKVSTDYSIDNDLIKINFEIHNCEKFYVCRSFSHDARKNWGLWEFDVVEFFVRAVGEEEYLEIQVSPLNQQFMLKIISPREIFYTPLDYSFKSTVNNKDNITQVSLELPNLWNTRDLEGNFFAILGSDQRNYFAMNLDESCAPNFHRTDLFKKL